MGNSIYVQHARSVIDSTVLGTHYIPEKAISDSELLNQERACFVSIHKKDDSLRGCIGTIEPVCNTLFEEIIRNATAACTRDSRFEPVKKEELDSLKVSVDILSLPEKVSSVDKLDPTKYGLILTDGKFRKAVLLPGLEGVKTSDEQIEIVKRKAGIKSNGVEGLEMYRFTSERFF